MREVNRDIMRNEDI